MYVKQISVFIENTPGRLAHFTKLLGDNNIDLVSLSVADTTHFGILRGIVEMGIRDRATPSAAGMTMPASPAAASRSVSYTHLDVYKRQLLPAPSPRPASAP